MRRVLLTCLLCVAALLFAAPAYAANGDYTIDELSTEITIEPNATAHIIERQVVTFEEDNLGLVWYLHVPEDGESVRISNVRVAPVDDGGAVLGNWVRLQMFDSNPSLQGRNPGDTAASSVRTKSIQPWYSYKIGDGMMRCYFPLVRNADEGSEANGSTSNSASTQEPPYRTYAIETDYTIRNRVRVYRDVAELYWRYVNDSLPSDSDDVNLLVRLPLPEGIEPAEVVESVTAWGHGPNEGTFVIEGDGTVTYHIDHISRGNYAEAHIIFPSYWMSSMDPNATNWFSDVRGPDAIAEEAEWVDVSQRGATWDNNVRVLFLVLAVFIILAGVLGVLRHGRSPKARRALIRVSATFVIVALAENLFFREPLTTLMLFILAAIVLLVAFMLPLKDEPGDNEPEADHNDAEPEAGQAYAEPEAGDDDEPNEDVAAENIERAEGPA